MTVDVPAALAAGAIGGLLMTLMRLGLRAIGVPLRLHVLRLWGEMLGAHRTAAEVLGLGVHLAGSAAIGLIYVAAFALIGLRNLTLAWGLLAGLVHWALAGIFMAAVPLFAPALPAKDRPGPFVIRHGALDAAVFVFGHVMYGVTFMLLYSELAAA